MKYKIVPNIFTIIMAVIIGGGIVKLFDFQSLTFEKPALAVVYIIAFILSIGFMVKKSKKK